MRLELVGGIEQFGVENLVSWINGNRRSCYLLHISTDHIYDGTGAAAEENIKLTNYYAFSKFAGELAAPLGVGLVDSPVGFGVAVLRARDDVAPGVHGLAFEMGA